MRSPAWVVLVVLVALPARATDRIYCEVGIGPVTGDQVTVPTIHSSGFVRSRDPLGIEQVSAEHVILKQSDNSVVNRRTYAPALIEVLTYVRGEVDIGHVYTAELTGWGSLGDDQAFCTESYAWEDPNPPSSPPPQTESPDDPTITCDWDVCSPILVDLDRRGFELTSVEEGAAFDLDRDGDLESTAWTSPASGDAWLALDRNGNGRIDDGGELFGNFTDQPASDEPHGYRALAVFDHDGDGRITLADPVFPELLLWVDRDHDGISRSDELQPLTAAGVTWLDLDYVESRARDRHGNELRYRALVSMVTGTTHSADVFLLTAP